MIFCVLYLCKRSQYSDGKIYSWNPDGRFLRAEFSGVNSYPYVKSTSFHLRGNWFSVTIIAFISVCCCRDPVSRVHMFLKTKPGKQNHCCIVMGKPLFSNWQQTVIDYMCWERLSGLVFVRWEGPHPSEKLNTFIIAQHKSQSLSHFLLSVCWSGQNRFLQQFLFFRLITFLVEIIIIIHSDSSNSWLFDWRFVLLLW